MIKIHTIKVHNSTQSKHYKIYKKNCNNSPNGYTCFRNPTVLCAFSYTNRDRLYLTTYLTRFTSVIILITQLTSEIFSELTCASAAIVGLRSLASASAASLSFASSASPRLSTAIARKTFSRISERCHRWRNPSCCKISQLTNDLRNTGTCFSWFVDDAHSMECFSHQFNFSYILLTRYTHSRRSWRLLCFINILE